MRLPSDSGEDGGIEECAPQGRSVPYRIARWLFRRSSAVLDSFAAGRQLTRFMRPWAVTRQAIAKVIRAHAHYAHGLILDAGCGEQLYRDLFAQYGRYVSLDLPPGRYPWRPDVRLPAPSIYGDGHALPFRDSTFDTVLSFGVFEMVSQPETHLAEICRVLRPGGVLMLQTWIPWQRSRSGEHHEFAECDLVGMTRQNHLAVETIVPLAGPWLTSALRAVGSDFIRTRAHGWMVVPIGILLFAGSMMDNVRSRQGNTIGYLMVTTKLLAEKWKGSAKKEPL